MLQLWATVMVLPALYAATALLDLDHPGHRAALSALGGLAALAATAHDKTEGGRDTAYRVGTGVLVSFIAAPFGAIYFKLEPTLTNCALVFGGVGLAAWYFMAAAVGTLKFLRDRKALQSFVVGRLNLGKEPPPTDQTGGS